ncbi:ClpP class serine protease [Paraburkholderia tropica]|uniref:S49 family peptidase n=1 Tax=Paraburkholderia tropica TaxID=92647 RepID=UPI00161B5D3D|nr:S49 family peptidase [Paraburkholderia tropica]MBB2999785.1 ClpP class serine protease [Paraburkholderia tropica]
MLVPNLLSAAVRPERGIPADAKYSIVNGIAVIPVVGDLTQYASDETTGYDWIKVNFLKALRDPKASAVVLSLNSYGGEVAGCFDLVDLIYESRSVKPLLAICSETAYSAAYAIASACEQVMVPRTGGVGSVGVITGHVDISGSLAQQGIAVTLIYSGARKSDGTETAPLTQTARAQFQRDVDAIGELFVATVARNRGLSQKAVRDTQAATFMGPAGVDIGFADAVMCPDDAFMAFAAQLQEADSRAPNPPAKGKAKALPTGAVVDTLHAERVSTTAATSSNAAAQAVQPTDAQAVAKSWERAMQRASTGFHDRGAV